MQKRKAAFTENGEKQSANRKLMTTVWVLFCVWSVLVLLPCLSHFTFRFTGIFKDFESRLKTNFFNMAFNSRLAEQSGWFLFHRALIVLVTVKDEFCFYFTELHFGCVKNFINNTWLIYWFVLDSFLISKLLSFLWKSKSVWFVWNLDTAGSSIEKIITNTMWCSFYYVPQTKRNQI